MSNNIAYDMLRSLPDALLSPLTQWHQDDLNASLAALKMRYDHEERMAMRAVQVECFRCLKVGMQTGKIDGDLVMGLATIAAIENGSNSYMLPGS